MLNTIFLVGGGKGGVGKSLMSMALLDFLEANGQRPFLVETDTSVPDVFKTYAEAVAGEPVNLDEREGWIDLVNERGRAVGENVARRECAALVAASSWASTPEGQLAFAFAKAGGLGEVARCTGRGMVSRDGWCTVLSERGRTMARWSVPAGGARNNGESP
ncbi:MAG TPA: hypothetical protein VGP07_02185 [Polyangia bacterium]|jgi:hypothetical protein